jgi:hypothetical protein
MTTMQSEVFEVFRPIGVPQDQASGEAAPLGKRDDDVGALKSDILVLKWMMGFVFALQVAIAVKLVVH